MPMPKGHKVKFGYSSVASIPGADDYKLIAKKCSNMGFKMGHSTARNIFLHAMMKVADDIQRSQGNVCTGRQLFEIARNPKFQMGVAEILSEE